MAIDTRSTVVSVAVVIGCALIPGVGLGIAAGIVGGLIVNVASDYAKKEWVK